MFSDDEAAALYDVLNPWGPSDDFYLRLVMGAGAVLDVGCGTGVLLHAAREAGHGGRLVGLDPDEAALRRARERDGTVEWIAGRAEDAAWSGEFALAVMASHAFQVFLGDDELRASLTAIRAALAPRGRFAFETRNPAVREWEQWRDAAMDVTGPDGRALRLSYEVESVDGDIVRLAETTSEPDGTPLRTDRSGLRFLDAKTLDAFLAESGFAVEHRSGDWSGGPFTPASATIITIARRV